VPHLVVAVTPEGQIVLRSNVSPDALRSFGEDLINVADKLRRRLRTTRRIDQSRPRFRAGGWPVRGGLGRSPAKGRRLLTCDS
jgi:hypothetical protein